MLKEGKGKSPKATDTVLAHYRGTLLNGKDFDNSYTRNEPANIKVDSVIKGWQEAVQLMVEGEKTRFWIPQRLAYDGQQGMPMGMLVFDVELVEEFLRAFAQSSGVCLHVNVAYGSNAHHTVEAVFKALGRAMSAAVELDPRVKGVPSTKGVLG